MKKEEIEEKKMAHTTKCPKSPFGRHSWVPTFCRVINGIDYQLHRCLRCNLEGMQEDIPGEDPRGSCG